MRRGNGLRKYSTCEQAGGGQSEGLNQATGHGRSIIARMLAERKAQILCFRAYQMPVG